MTARASATRAGDVGLVASAAAWMLAIRVLKFFVPLPRLVELMRSSRQPSGPRRPDLEARVARQVGRAARFLQQDGTGNCLEHSLVLYRFLTRLGAETEMVIGLRRAEGRLTGHAWILVDGVPVAPLEPGYEALASF